MRREHSAVNQSKHLRAKICTSPHCDLTAWRVRPAYRQMSAAVATTAAAASASPALTGTTAAIQDAKMNSRVESSSHGAALDTKSKQQQSEYIKRTVSTRWDRLLTGTSSRAREAFHSTWIAFSRMDPSFDNSRWLPYQSCEFLAECLMIACIREAKATSTAPKPDNDNRWGLRNVQIDAVADGSSLMAVALCEQGFHYTRWSTPVYTDIETDAVVNAVDGYVRLLADARHSLTDEEGKFDFGDEPSLLQTIEAVVSERDRVKQVILSTRDPPGDGSRLSDLKFIQQLCNKATALLSALQQEHQPVQPQQAEKYQAIRTILKLLRRMVSAWTLRCLRHSRLTLEEQDDARSAYQRLFNVVHVAVLGQAKASEQNSILRAAAAGPDKSRVYALPAPIGTCELPMNDGFGPVPLSDNSPVRIKILGPSLGRRLDDWLIFLSQLRQSASSCTNHCTLFVFWYRATGETIRSTVTASHRGGHVSRSRVQIGVDGTSAALSDLHSLRAVFGGDQKLDGSLPLDHLVAHVLFGGTNTSAGIPSGGITGASSGRGYYLTAIQGHDELTYVFYASFDHPTPALQFGERFRRYVLDTHDYRRFLQPLGITTLGVRSAADAHWKRLTQWPVAASRYKKETIRILINSNPSAFSAPNAAINPFLKGVTERISTLCSSLLMLPSGPYGRDGDSIPVLGMQSASVIVLQRTGSDVRLASSGGMSSVDHTAKATIAATVFLDDRRYEVKSRTASSYLIRVDGSFPLEMLDNLVIAICDTAASPPLPDSGLSYLKLIAQNVLARLASVLLDPSNAPVPLSTDDMRQRLASARDVSVWGSSLSSMGLLARQIRPICLWLDTGRNEPLPFAMPTTTASKAVTLVTDSKRPYSSSAFYDTDLVRDFNVPGTSRAPNSLTRVTEAIGRRLWKIKGHQETAWFVAAALAQASIRFSDQPMRNLANAIEGIPNRGRDFVTPFQRWMYVLLCAVVLSSGDIQNERKIGESFTAYMRGPTFAQANQTADVVARLFGAFQRRGNLRVGVLDTTNSKRGGISLYEPLARLPPGQKLNILEFYPANGTTTVGLALNPNHIVVSVLRSPPLLTTVFDAQTLFAYSVTKSVSDRVLWRPEEKAPPPGEWSANQYHLVFYNLTDAKDVNTERLTDVTAQLKEIGGKVRTSASTERELCVAIVLPGIRTDLTYERPDVVQPPDEAKSKAATATATAATTTTFEYDAESETVRPYIPESSKWLGAFVETAFGISHEIDEKQELPRFVHSSNLRVVLVPGRSYCVLYACAGFKAEDVEFERLFMQCLPAQYALAFQMNTDTTRSQAVRSFAPYQAGDWIQSVSVPDSPHNHNSGRGSRGGRGRGRGRGRPTPPASKADAIRMKSSRSLRNSLIHDS